MNDPFSIIKGRLQSRIFSIFFAEDDLSQGDIIIINYDSSLDSGMYILKGSLSFDDIDYIHQFFLW